MGKKIAIEPVTRIEGHARVTIHVDDDGKVENAYLHIDQFRGFEKFSEGRMYYEMPQITPRICGICPVSHHLGSAKACDAVSGIEPPRTASLLRELMHMGQTIQSHAMHFFHLAGPDLLFSFDADPKIRNVIGIVQVNPTLATKAVMLRKFGQEIIKTLGGKKIHPVFAVAGGVNNVLTEEERDTILKDMDEHIAFIQQGIEIAKRWVRDNMETVETFAVFPTGYMGLVKEDGALELYEGKIRLIGPEGEPWELFDPSDYLEYIGEHVEDWSYLKFPFYKKLGYPDGVYRVGPLGRLNVADKISTPLANEEFKNFKAINEGKPVEGSLWYHYARLIETLYAMERVKELLDDPDILSNDIRAYGGELQSEGVGCVEAPRGTLLHHYKVDEGGKLLKVNLIIATGHNNWAMSKSVDDVAKQYVDGNNLTEGMLNRVEVAIRAYDPCLSCSTHALGKMPIILEMYDKDGNLLDQITRDSKE
ncbi:Ni/Fe hydrogenase subunit alpha [Candidatus Poribacteria bacterium]|nr:Ni/Fe hydrogenase subunit alpha [Candidatus Poribacteria bacterium]